MSCSRTCLKGAVVVGLIAALTPGLWAQSLQQETRTVSGERSAGSVPIEAQRTLPGLESKLSDMAASATRAVAPPTEAAAGSLLELDPLTGLLLFTENSNDGYAAFRGMVFIADEPIVVNGASLFTLSSNGLNATFELREIVTIVGDVLLGSTVVRSASGLLQGPLEYHGLKFAPIALQVGQAYLLRVGYEEPAEENWFYNFDPVFFGDPPVDIGPVTLIDGTQNGNTGNFVAPPLGLQLVPDDGDLIWFFDQDEFEAFNAGEGKVLKGIEDFEEAVLNPGDGIAVDDPLVSGIPNPPVFPVGLTGLPNLQVQSNLSGGNPTDPNPRGANGLGAFGAPGGNFVSDVVIANFFVDSLDLIFLIDEKTGVGGNTLHFNNSGTIEMRVYDINNNFLGMMPAPADPAGTNFLGVWSPIPIGRINVFSPQGGAEGLDNIQAWQEGNPCPSDLDGSGEVDVKDLLILLGAWGPNKGHPADLDGSGEVDVKDLLILLGAWGPCPDGNVCEGQVCGEFVECGFGEPFDCFCWTLADGTGICLQNFLCADVEPCIDGDCPDGFVCVFQSCCGDAFCVPIIKCDDGAAAGGDTKGSGPTGSGQFIEASQSAPTRPQNVGTVPRIRR